MDTSERIANKRAMDSAEKVLFHKEWLESWQKDPFSVFPIYMEISPAGYCNHRCKFCAFDYLRYKKTRLSREALVKVVREMAECGVKAIQFAGEGEPLLNPYLAEAMKAASDAGVEVSMLTNGVFLDRRFVDKALKTIKWFQVSIDAGERLIYAKIHRANPKDFNKALENLSYAVSLRDKKRLSCEIGAQMILLPENYMEAVDLTRTLVDVGVDYLTIKPYSHHPLSHHKDLVSGHNCFYKKIAFLEEEVKKVAKGFMEIDFRKIAMSEIETEKTYNRCYSTPTAWGYITADGDVYSCSAFLGDKRFLLGNIKEQGFKEIWMGEKRKAHLSFMANYDVRKNCRRVCRMNRTNITLFCLKEGEKIQAGEMPGRVNFI